MFSKIHQIPLLLIFQLSWKLLFCQSQNLPICIVGGGISGLNLGHLIQSKNESVLLFEKSEKVGGKLDVFRVEDEIQVSLGPVFFTPAYDSLFNYIRKFNLTAIPFHKGVWIFEPYTGMVVPAREFLNLRPLRHIFLSACRRYGTYQREYLRNGNLDFGYTKAGKMPQLFQPLGVWLEERGLRVLKPMFRGLMTEEGYGAIEDTPALYALKIFDEALLTNAGLNENIYTILEGFDVLAKKMAQGLEVKLKEEVFDVTRSTGGKTQILKSRSAENGKVKVYECKKVVLAYPPLDVEKVVKDLDEEEKEVLSHVRVTKYAVGVHQIPGWDKGVYGNVGVGFHPVLSKMMGYGSPIAFAQQTFKKLENIFSSYCWIRGEFTTIPTKGDLDLMEVRLNKTLRGLEADGQLVRTFLKPTQKHPYFPHVVTRSLQEGFYEKFEKIQGKGGLYYATTLLTFESMHFALKMTEELAAKYF